MTLHIVFKMLKTKPVSSNSLRKREQNDNEQNLRNEGEIKMKKKLLSILLCAMMLCTMMSTLAMAAALPFTDVKTNAWYYNDVKTAYESGLIAGKSATSFDPDANLTYAEAVKLAACMHQKNSIGSISLQKGEPWYQSYVNYCKTNGIISKDYRWNDNATRAGYIEIFAKALPDSSLKAINTVADGSIPDVSMSHPQAASIYKLYRAGIVIGVDTKYNCSPNSNIKRSEVSAILTRMMNANKRLSFTIGEQKTTPPLIITTQPKSVTATEDEQVELSVAVSGGKAPYSYQWQSESQGIWGDLEDSADYWASESATLYIKAYKNSWTTNEPLRCIITDSDGNSVTSNSANISIKNEATPLTITSQPKNATAPEGTQAEFSVMVTGGKAPYTFEWYECDPGDTNFSKVVHRAEYYEHYDIMDTASTSALTVKEVGNYYFQQNGIKYRCEITDADGNKVTSNAATLTVI